MREVRGTAWLCWTFFSVNTSTRHYSRTQRRLLRMTLISRKKMDPLPRKCDSSDQNVVTGLDFNNILFFSILCMLLVVTLKSISHYYCTEFITALVMRKYCMLSMFNHFWLTLSSRISIRLEIDSYLGDSLPENNNDNMRNGPKLMFSCKQKLHVPNKVVMEEQRTKILLP